MSTVALKLPLWNVDIWWRSDAPEFEVGGELACARRANCVLNWVCWAQWGGATAVSPPTEAPETLVTFVGQAPGVVVRQTPGATCCLLCCPRLLVSSAAF